MNMRDDVIRIEPGEPGRLAVHLPYSVERVEKIKTIPGRRWDPLHKVWSVPASPGMPDRLRALFASDRLEVLVSSKHPLPAPVLPVAHPLVDKLRLAVRARHFSPSTEKAYANWAERFLRANALARPEDLGESEIARFLSDLASRGHVAASTQNQALHSLLFFFQKVLGKHIGLVNGVVQANRAKRLPIVLSREEVRSILAQRTSKRSGYSNRGILVGIWRGDDW